MSYQMLFYIEYWKGYFISIISNKKIFLSEKVKQIQILSFLQQYFVNKYFVG